MAGSVAGSVGGGWAGAQPARAKKPPRRARVAGAGGRALTDAGRLADETFARPLPVYADKGAYNGGAAASGRAVPSTSTGFRCASSLAQAPPQPSFDEHACAHGPLRASGADLALGQPTRQPSAETAVAEWREPSSLQAQGAVPGASTAPSYLPSSWAMASASHHAQLRARDGAGSLPRVSTASVFDEMDEIASQSRQCDRKLRQLRQAYSGAVERGGEQAVEPLRQALAVYDEERRQLEERHAFWRDRAWLVADPSSAALSPGRRHGRGAGGGLDKASQRQRTMVRHWYNEGLDWPAQSASA